ncbi:DUF7446 family protein [Lonsdalea populi]|uniref:Uncharacterized protein n=1 Tax=Lonsdalea populi TaxID=1172565 RepID=A0ABX9EQJ3_9GAMM|nr:hypothetical protein [Lonsdalea populi]OSN01307.1 hypothetical protein AU499_07280 [Lonsdalea populi]QPQ24961.1 hypothetical protein I6N93_03945 [Lonsdalea populi]RAT32520.1 hypothetical protein AU492_12405 [Lonsdalea populi]RAT33980.1 hypothetical protein AU493_13950 [Lonsdalea populi]RAT41661.1 hypothetical protein AU495_14000 [Lonsdalea populi]
MKHTDLEYRVGYTPLSGRLYAGLVRKDNGKWEDTPHEVTEWAMLAVAQKLAREENDILYPLSGGRVMRLSAVITGPESVEGADE